MASARTPNRLTATVEARKALAGWRRDHGPHTLLLSWPGGVVCLPSAAFTPAPFDVIVGHISGCPIQADLRQIGFYAERSAVIDVRHTIRPGRPVVHLRPTAAGSAQLN